tara:strand:+ start:509 stop:712 length:204 start_codon:yes stop_codon:yes gene_type:complete
MKYFLIIWLCINDPNLPLSNTCQQLILDNEPFDTVIACNEEAAAIYQSVKPAGNVYLTSFCSLKPSK